MKLSLSLTVLAAICLLAGCASEGQNYAKAHPELTAVQRKMFNTGKIPDGTAVAGLTRAQVHLIMGGDPTTFDRVGDDDVWIFSHKKAIAASGMPTAGPSDSGLDTHNAYTERADNPPRVDIDVKCSVFFQGDIATHAQNHEDKP